jgi:hypothetical protein
MDKDSPVSLRHSKNARMPECVAQMRFEVGRGLAIRYFLAIILQMILIV